MHINVLFTWSLLDVEVWKDILPTQYSTIKMHSLAVCQKGKSKPNNEEKKAGWKKQEN